MAQRYNTFRAELPALARQAQLTPGELTFTELRTFVRAFLREDPW